MTNDSSEKSASAAPLGSEQNLVSDRLNQTPVSVEPIAKEYMIFFKDKKVNLIDTYFSVAKDLGIIHLSIDDVPHDGKSYSVGGKPLTSFANCSYLGLEIHDKVKAGAIEAIERYGLSFNMSRAYASNPLLAELETLLSEITGAYTLATLSTGRAHEAFMSVMIQPGDLVILDQQVHTTVQIASGIAVARGATVTVVPHNDMLSLNTLLEDASDDGKVNNVWYLGDGLYSMYGDFAPVQTLVSLLDKYPKFHCYLDDAHALSILGRHGRGYVLSQMDELHEKMVVALSLGKSFGMGQGGCLVIPRKEWYRKIQIAGGSLIFGSPLSIPSLGAGIASAKLHLSEEIVDLQKRLRNNLEYFDDQAKARGLSFLSSRQSPIKYAKFGAFDRAIAAAKDIFDQGMHINITAYPAVPRDFCGVRLTLTVHHTHADIDAILNAVGHAYRHTEALEATR